ncbi:hypothetical protein GCM10023339_01370 [Alloalcanivorax gelatiniphagus]
MTTLSPTRATRATGTAASRTTRRALAVGAATLLALATWAGLAPGLGVDLVVDPGTSAEMAVGAAAVLVASLVAGLAGWGVLALLERYAGARGLRVWQVGAVAVYLVSLVPLLAPGSTGTATRISLALLHTVVVTAVVLGLSRPARTR